MKPVEEDVADWHIELNFHLGLNVSAEHLQDSEFIFIADIRQFASSPIFVSLRRMWRPSAF
ncbi:MAG: hypothetical protein ACR5LF_10425 [Symbiopectobacterium sp.]